MWVEFLDVFQFFYLSEDSALNGSVCRWSPGLSGVGNQKF